MSFMKGGRTHGNGGYEDEGVEEIALHEQQVPEGYTAEAAKAALTALSSHSRRWLPLLLSAFVNTPANQRGHIGACIASYACISDPADVAILFRSALGKLMKVNEQARTGELGKDAVYEGGESDTERRCTFMEASLLLGGGLDAGGVGVLWKAAVPGTKEKDPAIQKKSYKIMAYVCESRPDFVVPHAQAVVEVLLGGGSAALSAAKRYRLRCLKAIIIELVQNENGVADALDVSALPGVMQVDMESSGGSGGNEATAVASLVLTPLITEIILCVKEANKRTRAAAFDLLVDVATEMHEADPPPLLSMGDGENGSGGGLRSLVNIVLSGLVGATPHMISASVMALARLLFEFAPVLADWMAALLPTVLLLLRSKAREVIKSVLGFIKVCFCVSVYALYSRMRTSLLCVRGNTESSLWKSIYTRLCNSLGGIYMHIAKGSISVVHLCVCTLSFSH